MAEKVKNKEMTQDEKDEQNLTARANLMKAAEMKTEQMHDVEAKVLKDDIVQEVNGSVEVDETHRVTPGTMLDDS